MKRMIFRRASAWLWFAACILSMCSEPEKPRPEIISITPAKGAVGDQVSISGKNLGAVTGVKFGNASIVNSPKSETTIVTVVAPGSVPGATQVTVVSDAGASNALPFEVLHSVPEITAIEPDKASSGMEVTIKGKYFETVSGVKFGDKTISDYVSKADEAVKVLVPAGLPLGATDVTITTEGGTSEKSGFTVVGKPTISKFTPKIGPALTPVQITGTYLLDASKVLFSTGEATSFQVKSATLIEAVVPVSATTGKITVITPGGSAVSTDDYVLKDGPEIDKFEPISATVSSDVTITGKNFDAGGVKVKFGSGTATSVTVVSATQIKAKVPNTATTGKVTVETLVGSVVSKDNFNLIGAPTVTVFSPSSGVANAEVTITGTNFVSVSAVKFGTTAVSAANYSIVSASTIKAKVPSGSSSGKISVTTPAGTGTSDQLFTVIGPPSVSTFLPVKGAPGIDVVINGTNFVNVSSVKFNGVTVPASDFVVNDVNKITATVPASATTGKITVVTPLGTGTSPTDFYITPVILAMTPATGGTATPVEITGTNLGGAMVRFGTTNATPTSNSNERIVVNVPSGLPIASVNVTVENNGGISNAKTFTVTVPPVLDEVVATQNIGNQLMLFVGSNMTGATKVRFRKGGNTTEANPLTTTAKVVTVIIPGALGTGQYDVSVLTPKGESNAKKFDLVSAQNGDTGGVTLGTGGSVTSLPAGYVPLISNQWSNDAANTEKFLLAGFSGQVEVTLTSSVDSNVFFQGEGLYDNANVGGVVNNFIEFTVAGVRYAGVWTPPSNYSTADGKYCTHHMTLISAESGKVLKLTVDDPSCTN